MRRPSPSASGLRRTLLDRLPRVCLVLAGLVLASLVLDLDGAASASAQADPSPIPDAFEQAAGLGIQLLEAPAALGGDPRAQSYVIDHVPAGSLIERRILISNNTPDAVSVALYAGAAEVTDVGWSPAEGRGGNDLASWISVAPEGVELGPVEQVEVLLRIQVPEDTPPGERYAVVWAERGSPDIVPEGEVGLASRVGIRVYLSVGPGDGPPTEFEVRSLTAITRADGTAVVRARVDNTGERALDLTGALTLTGGPGGLSTEPLPAPPTTLGRAAGADIEIEVGREFPSGPWDATLEMRSGSVAEQVSATLTFPTTPGEAEAAPVEEPAQTRALLILTAIAMQLAIGGTALFALRADEGWA